MMVYTPVWSGGWTLWLYVGLALVVFAILLVIVARVAKRKISSCRLGSIYWPSSFGPLSGLSLLTVALVFNLMLFSFIFVLVNIASVRPFINNLFLNRKPSEPTSRHFDRDQLINAVVDTVAYLSKPKPGPSSPSETQEQPR
jgi:hypothetical protein